MKTFGERVAGVEYVPRPGGYAVIARDGAIAVVTTPSGVHLPGGGLDPGESAVEATLREVREECGFEVEIVREIGKADEYIQDVVSGVHYLKHCTFFEAIPVGSKQYECEADHVLAWITPADAIATLLHKSQRWAVECYVQSR